jgi:hypothetical protein
MQSTGLETPSENCYDTAGSVLQWVYLSIQCSRNLEENSWVGFSPPELSRSLQATPSHIWVTLWFVSLVLTNGDQTEVRRSSRWLGANYTT